MIENYLHLCVSFFLKMEKTIYMKDWLSLKPYEKPTLTDMYYLKLCNEVKKTILKIKKVSFELQLYLPDDTNIFCCFLTSYFEDLISGTNIWNTFVKIHQKLYNKPLPFFNLDDYQEAEINKQDIKFLIWYYLNLIQDEIFITPYNDFIEKTAEKIFNIFDKEWEYAPENDYLTKYYQIEQDEVDFYAARNFIDTILFKTYLFYPDTHLDLLNKEFDIFQQNREELIFMALNETRDRLLHSSYTKLLSLQGKEWASEILGPNHHLYNDFLSISKKIQGLFLYKGQDENNIYIEHISSSKNFILTKKSFDGYKSLKEVDTIIFIGIVLWRDEWWFSGVFFQQPYRPEIVLEEKKSIESKMTLDFLEKHDKKTEEILNDQLVAFKKYNNGSQIVFLPADKIEEFYFGFLDFYNNSLILTEKEKKDKEDIFENSNQHLNIPKGVKSGLVFFNPKSGCLIAFEINSAFPMPSNPFFNVDESKEHVLDLLLGDFAPELVWFCIDNCKDELPFFTNDVGKKYLIDFDFLLRFCKTEDYYSQPSFTFT